MSDPTSETPKLITLAGGGIQAGVAYAAIVVPGTEDLLAVDERFPPDPTDPEGAEADWRITHIPTMFAVAAPGFTDAPTMDRAMEIARRFYREAKALGWDLQSKSAAVVIGPYNAMPKAERRAFWGRVAGRATTEGARQS